MASISDRTYEDGVLCARAEDAVRLSDLRNVPCFLPFLDQRQQVLVKAVFHRLHADNVRFFGGYPDCERAMVGCFPSWAGEDESFPITTLVFRYRAQTKLTHRDILGTVMSCGVKRDKIGDILCGDGFSVAFVDESIAPFLQESIDRVAGEGVTVEIGYDGELPCAHEYQEIRTTVASPRLDCAVKALLGVSRETAAARITAGTVSLNHVVCTDLSAHVSAGDCVSIAGSGRFWVDAVEQPTKKGRLVFKARKCL